MHNRDHGTEELYIEYAYKSIFTLTKIYRDCINIKNMFTRKNVIGNEK